MGGLGGKYADIVGIIAPSSAVPGEKVYIEVRIRNIYSVTIGIMVGGALEYGVTPWPTIDYPDNRANVAAGSSHTFYGSFTMPDSDVVIHAYSYYYATDGGWYFDDEETKGIETGVPVEGTITGKWINKAPEGTHLTIPASVTADDNTFEVGVRYKNLGGSVTAGCEVKVRDPDGTLRASPAIDWTGMSTNEELSTEYNICRVDKAGTWTVTIRFLTSDYVEMDRFEGTLFYAQGELVSEFSRFEIPDYNTV